MRIFLSLFLIIVHLNISSQLNAAAPVTHAYLTERFFIHFPHYSEEERRSFMLGTLFPDIQYLGEVQREHTHMAGVSLDDVLREPSAFMAGVKYHSYVDWVREEFVLKEHAYENLASLVEPQSIKAMCTMLKLIEDEHTYYMYTWDGWSDNLLFIDPEELNWQINPRTIRKWHNILYVTFSNAPSSLLFLVSLTGTGLFGLTTAELAYWGKMLRPTAHHRLMRNYVYAMLDHFEKRLQERAYHEP